MDEYKQTQKKNGAYYSPIFIAEYISKQAIFSFLSNENNGTIPDLIGEYSSNPDVLREKVRTIKIIDPSCGEGIFLVNSAEILIGIHYRIEDFKKGGNGSEIVSENVVKNTFKKDYENGPENLFRDNQIRIVKDVLKNNIYGVDINPESVEVAKKALFQKFGNGFAKGGFFSLLNKNILCGNALSDGKLSNDPNSFTWETGFPDIFRNGGFDVVVGNPPYVDIKDLDHDTTRFLFENYETASNRTNLYSIFIERVFRKILKDKGYLGFIIPNSLLYNSSYKAIRKIIVETSEIRTIIRLPDRIFDNASVETIILISNKINKPKDNSIDAFIFSPKSIIKEVNLNDCLHHRRINSKYWKSDNKFRFQLIDEGIQEILKKIEMNSLPLAAGEDGICDISLGITPYDKYKGHSKDQIKNKIYHSNQKTSENHKPLLSGADIKRYSVSWAGDRFIKYGKWLGAPRKKFFFTCKRILVRQIISGNPPRIYAGYTEDEYYNTQIAFNLIPKKPNTIDLRYILAILNSKMMSIYHRNKFLDETKTVFQKILIENARNLPLKIPNDEVQLKVCKLVRNLETLISSRNEFFKNAIIEIEDGIDELVYIIYGLSAEEIIKLESTMQYG